MVDGFSIGRVVVEGFKGFTTRKEIDLRNRHAFLLGRNGNGKSSIIEAVRWGLFGSTGRRNDIVANQGYSGGCRVEISLTRDATEWRLRRSLIRGVSGGSDAELVDEHGKEHSIRDIMPQLDSVNAGEGTHIIFAPQSAPLRRQPEDLTAFERTVFNHLGLTHPRVLLSHLETFLSGQEETERDLDERITTVRTQIDAQISQLQHQRGRVLAAPPWEADRPPTVAKSEKKTRALIEKISGQPPDPELSGVSLGALIETAEEALESKELHEQGLQRTKLDRVRDGLRRLGEVREAQEHASARQAALVTAEGQLEALSKGESADELRARAESLRQATDTLHLKRQLAVDAIEVLHRDDEDARAVCPVCAHEHPRQQLEATLSDAAKTLPEGDLSHLRELNEQLQNVEEASRRLQDLRSEVAALELKVQTLIETDELREFAPAVHEGEIGTVIEGLMEQEASIAGEIEDREEWFKGVRAELSRLGDEEKYHQIQNDLHGMGMVKAELQRVERAYGDLASFGESVRDIHGAVESSLNVQLADKVPGVAEELTRVFVALTRHPYYDRLLVDGERLPRLELQVASSQDSGGRGHATGVLNGQAQSALELVPYFALGQASETPTEVYLVLLDDPTRAFDGEHVEILIERLADLGRRVQLIVGSQETARFRELLPQSFARSSYVVVEPKNWSYADGPELDTEYE